MFKKISKIFPVLFLVVSLGVLLLTQSKIGLIQSVEADDCSGATNTCCGGDRYMADGSIGPEPWCGTVGGATIDGPCNCDGSTLSCTPCGDGTACQGGSCVSSGNSCTVDGSCSRFDCNNVCTIGGSPVDCQTTCGIWIGHDACNGETGGCSSADTDHYNAELSNKGSIQYSEDYWCTTQQMDTSSGGGEFAVVYIGDGGAWCADWFDGSSGETQHECGGGASRKEDLDWDCTEEVIEPPAANFSGNCYPADQEYNNLSYRFSLNSITGTGDFTQATLFLSFSQGNPSTDAETAFKDFLGTPNWISGSWYGYYLDRQFSMNDNALDFKTWDEQILIGGNEKNQKTIDDLVNQTQVWVNEGVLTSDFKYGIEASVALDSNGVINKTNSVGGSHVSILPDACAEPPAAPQCTNVKMFPSVYPPSYDQITDFSTLAVDQDVNFQCESSPANDNQIYKYRVIEVDGNDQTLGHVIENFSDGYGIGRSGSFVIPGYAQYFAQCVTCSRISDFEFNCEEWEPIPNLTIIDN